MKSKLSQRKGEEIFHHGRSGLLSTSVSFKYSFLMTAWWKSSLDRRLRASNPPRFPSKTVLEVIDMVAILVMGYNNCS